MLVPVLQGDGLLGDVWLLQIVLAATQRLVLCCSIRKSRSLQRGYRRRRHDGQCPTLKIDNDNANNENSDGRLELEWIYNVQEEGLCSLSEEYE